MTPLRIVIYKNLVDLFGYVVLLVVENKSDLFNKRFNVLDFIF